MVVVGLVLALLPACRPLYWPAVPAEETLPPIGERLRVSDVRVERDDGVPVVAFVPHGVSGEGWLAVQWYPPAGGTVASASTWLAPEVEGEVVRVAFPRDVPRTREGRWRAVLSFGSRVLRQVEWEEPGGA